MNFGGQLKTSTLVEVNRKICVSAFVLKNAFVGQGLACELSIYEGYR
ncbi:hypothetical protein VISI1226_22290 [Vibrio sinaloensis DSM 21326]|uniref:Uncharacterized protein n=1 Tax=Vibrio sinaloensis DSM 21326 TaxID=945550 RepID=E8M6M8_PHOS4|nr:hypothetical protein VISI1226_22290 [Vibrio sinaloensis DSM 21326]